ncbi:hypothetical protein M422DRAFT_248876 [Sphaerobolus stellatus SS14]|nr:hypothetical protein M422DRAFT_248876 [Sphaerobolus stellatus SS14]
MATTPTVGKSPPPPPPIKGLRSKDAPVKDTTSDKYKGKVQDVPSAKIYLESTTMVVIGEPHTVVSLSVALFHISQSGGTKQSWMDATRAVAFLMVEAGKVTEAKEVARRITEQMVMAADQMESSMAEAKAVVVEIQKAAKEMQEERTKTLKGMAAALAVISKTTSYVTVVATGTPAAAQAQRAAGATDQTNMTRIVMLAKGNAKSRQILVDEQIIEGGVATLATLEPAELVAKANLALDAIAGSFKTPAKAVAANRLRNGGIVYELDSQEAAGLLQHDETVRKAFADKYSANATIKPWLYPIIVERVQTSFNPEAPSHL